MKKQIAAFVAGLTILVGCGGNGNQSDSESSNDAYSD
jgi:hypothetical protein